jgi:hypothetical protein
MIPGGGEMRCDTPGGPADRAASPIAVPLRVRCPVCRQETLTGTAWTVPEEEVRFNAHFLPCAASGEDGDDALVPLRGDFFCPEDLYAVAGPVQERDGIPHFPDGGGTRLARLYRVRNVRLLGERARFVVEAMIARRLDPRRLIPPDADAGGVEVFLLAWRFLDACLTPREAAGEIGRRFDALKRRGWNPFATFAAAIGTDAPAGDDACDVFRAAVLDLQLADLFYLLRRQIDRRAAYPAFTHLSESLTRLKNLVQHVRGLDVELIADVLFHTLRMADHDSDAGHRRLLLETAYHCAGYVLRRRFQPGGDPNRRLDEPGGNPDVLLLLVLRLGRELGLSPGDEEIMVGLLAKRLDAVPAYGYPDPASPVAMRIARLGKEIRRHLADPSACRPIVPPVVEADAPH